MAMREDGGTLGVFSPKKVGPGLRPGAALDRVTEALVEARGAPGGRGAGRGWPGWPSCGRLVPKSSWQGVLVALGHRIGA